MQHFGLQKIEGNLQILPLKDTVARYIGVDTNGQLQWMASPSTTDTYLTGASFATGTGVLTLTLSNAATVTANLDGRYAMSSHNHSLDSLSNVNTAGLATGQSLSWNGTSWVPAAFAAATGSGNYIQNQNAAPQAANYYINGTGTFGANGNQTTVVDDSGFAFKRGGNAQLHRFKTYFSDSTGTLAYLSYNTQLNGSWMSDDNSKDAVVMMLGAYSQNQPSANLSFYYVPAGSTAVTSIGGFTSKGGQFRLGNFSDAEWNTLLPGKLFVRTVSTTDQGLVVRGVASQTGNLIEAQNSGGTAKFAVDASGNVSGTTFNIDGITTLKQHATNAGRLAIDFGGGADVQVYKDISAGNTIQWTTSNGYDIFWSPQTRKIGFSDGTVMNVYGPGNFRYVTLKNDGTDGILTTNAGGIKLTPNSGIVNVTGDVVASGDAYAVRGRFNEIRPNNSTGADLLMGLNAANGNYFKFDGVTGALSSNAGAFIKVLTNTTTLTMYGAHTQAIMEFKPLVALDANATTQAMHFINMNPSITMNASGNTGNVYGYRFNPTITNSVGATTQIWSYYSDNSTVKGYHAGNFMIGSNTDNGQKLQVAGQITANTAMSTPNSHQVSLMAGFKGGYLVVEVPEGLDYSAYNQFDVKLSSQAYSDAGGAGTISIGGFNAPGAGRMGEPTAIGRVFCSQWYRAALTSTQDGKTKTIYFFGPMSSGNTGAEKDYAFISTISTNLPASRISEYKLYALADLSSYPSVTGATFSTLYTRVNAPAYATSASTTPVVVNVNGTLQTRTAAQIITDGGGQTALTFNNGVSLISGTTYGLGGNLITNTTINTTNASTYKQFAIQSWSNQNYRGLQFATSGNKSFMITDLTNNADSIFGLLIGHVNGDGTDATTNIAGSIGGVKHRSFGGGSATGLDTYIKAGDGPYANKYLYGVKAVIDSTNTDTTYAPAAYAGYFKATRSGTQGSVYSLWAEGSPVVFKNTATNSVVQQVVIGGSTVGTQYTMTNLGGSSYMNVGYSSGGTDWGISVANGTLTIQGASSDVILSTDNTSKSIYLKSGNTNIMTVNTGVTINADTTFTTPTSTGTVTYGFVTGVSGKIISNSTAMYVRADTGRALSLGANTTNDVMVIDSTTNVRIGFGASQTQKFAVNGDYRIGLQNYNSELHGHTYLKQIVDGAGNFITIDGATGRLYYRTASEVVSDLGVAPATGGNYVAKAGDSMSGTLKILDTSKVQGSTLAGPTAYFDGEYSGYGGTLTTGVTYYFRAFYLNGDYEYSQPSNEVVQTLSAGNDEIDISWTASTTATYVRVYIGTAPNTYTRYYELPGGSTALWLYDYTGNPAADTAESNRTIYYGVAGDAPTTYTMSNFQISNNISYLPKLAIGGLLNLATYKLNVGGQSRLAGDVRIDTDGNKGIMFGDSADPIKARDIRTENNSLGFRIYATDVLTTVPNAAAIQFWGNNNANYPGHFYMDSGAHNNASLFFRTAVGGASVATRMEIKSYGTVQIKAPNTGYNSLEVTGTSTFSGNTTVGGTLNMNRSTTGLSKVSFTLGATEYGSVGVDTGSGIMTVAPVSNYHLTLGSSLYVKSSGNVGIGNSAPATTLDVAGTIGSTGGFKTYYLRPESAPATPTYSFYGDLDTGWYTPGADTQAWVTSGVTRMTLNNSSVVFNVTPSAPAGDRGEVFGAGATASGTYGVAVGYGATAGHTSTGIGALANAGSQGVAVGTQAVATDRNIAIGYGASAGSNAFSIAMIGQTNSQFSGAFGYDSQTNHNYTFAFGVGARTSATNQFVIGSTGTTLNTIINGYVQPKFVYTNSNGLTRLNTAPNATYASQINNITGSLRILMPTGTLTTMMMFRVRVYNYVADTSVEFVIAGYTYSGNSWYQPSVYQYGDTTRNFNVRYGVTAGGQMAVYIGETNTPWTYPQVEVVDMMAGYTGGGSANWKNDWTVDFVTAQEGVTITKQAQRATYAGGSDYIQNQYNSAQTAQAWINGIMRANSIYSDGGGTFNSTVNIATGSGYELNFTGTAGANIYAPNTDMYLLAGTGKFLSLGGNGTDGIVKIGGAYAMDVVGNTRVTGTFTVYKDATGGNGAVTTTIGSNGITLSQPITENAPTYFAVSRGKTDQFGGLVLNPTTTTTASASDKTWYIGKNPMYGVGGNNEFSIWTHDGSAFAQHMRIDNSGNTTLGRTAVSSTATPNSLSLGGTYADTTGDMTKMKFKLHDNGTNSMGLSVSSNTLEYIAAASMSHKFYVGGTNIAAIYNNGMSIGSNVTIGSTAAPTFTGLYVGSSAFFGGGSFQVNNSGNSKSLIMSNGDNLVLGVHAGTSITVGSAGTTIPVVVNGNLKVLNNAAGTIAEFGSTTAGTQLLVNDTTSGTIYGVNDVTGLPIIEANSNWDVMIYDFPNVVLKKQGSTITINGTLKVNDSTQSAVTKTLAAGANVVLSLDKTLFRGMFIEYVLYNSTNQRAGSIQVNQNGTNLVFNETSTLDLGNTSAITSDVAINGANVEVKFNGVPDATYTVKVIYRYI